MCKNCTKQFLYIQVCVKLFPHENCFCLLEKLIQCTSLGIYTAKILQFVPRAKSVHLQHNRCLCLLFGRWFRKEKDEKEQKLGKKVSIKLHFMLKMGLKKDRNKAEVKERKKTTLHLLCIFGRCQVVFLHSFISALFLSFFQAHP